jgi:hypothetical protein
MHMDRRILLILWIDAFILCALANAQAQQPKHDARTDRLAGLNKAELTLLESALQAGPVALIEFSDDDQDELPAINLATYVDASAEQVAAIIANPNDYPTFMPTIDTVHLVAKNGLSTVYDWGWTLAVFQLGGRNNMTVFAPATKSSNTGYRITIDSLSGDFGAGRYSIRLLDTAKNRSLLALSVRLDLRRSNYVVRQMAKASRSVNRSANLAMACSILFAIRQEAEKRAGRSPLPENPHTLIKPLVDLRRLAPLLSRGDLFFFDMTGERLNQLTVLGQINYQTAVVRRVLTDADAFGEALVSGSHVQVLSREKGAVEFAWNVALPLVGSSGTMRLKDDGTLISVDATSGMLNGGSWRFETSAPTPSSTIVLGWGSFDLKKSTWLLQSLIAADPYLEHGLAAAADIMLVRSLRARAKKLTAEKAPLNP